MSISPDGATIYQPSLEKDRWYVLNAADGSVITEIVPDSKAHNTVLRIRHSESDGYYNRKLSVIGPTPTARRDNSLRTV